MRGLPSLTVECHLIQGLMNELRVKLFGGDLRKRPCVGVGGWGWGVVLLDAAREGTAPIYTAQVVR